MFREVPQYTPQAHLSDAQNVKAKEFFDYLHGGSMLNLGGPEHIEHLLDNGAPGEESGLLLNAKVHMLEQATQPIVKAFVHQIWMRGLYASVDDCRSCGMSSDRRNGVVICTAVIAGRIMTTLNFTTSTKSEARSISFLAAESDPTNIGIRASHGTLYDLENIVQRTARRFKDLTKAIQIMKPDVVYLADTLPLSTRPVPIGRKPRAATAKAGS